jgi:GTP-binding protein
VVRGRGEVQLAILIETLRREGWELGVTRPEVIFKFRDGRKLEPVERVYIDCAAVYAGNVTMQLSAHKGQMLVYTSHEGGRAHLEFSVPSRALIGYRDRFLTDTKGTGIMNAIFSGYEEYRGDFDEFLNGFLVSDQAGKGVTYGLYHLEPHGQLFITAGEPVYEGMVVGQHNLEFDLVVNPAKEKKLSNMRSVLKDEALTLTPIQPMTLERAILLLQEEEMVEVTPRSVRIRKIILSETDRRMAGRASRTGTGKG